MAELSSLEGFQENPDLVWAWYQHRRRSVASRGPNKAHVAITELQSKFPQVNVITQNVDILHQLAHTKDILELRGNFFENHCSLCGREFTGKYSLSDTAVPHCRYCDGLIRPSVYWFGETIPSNVIEKAESYSKNCDFFIAVGIYGEMRPGSDLAIMAKENGAYTIEISPFLTILSDKVDDFILSPASKALPALISTLTREIF